MNNLLLTYVDLFVFVANGIIVVGILCSWFAGLRRMPGVETLLGMAEVILTPARKLVSPRGPLDWSPLMTIIGLQILQSALHSLIK